jgi:hypothetical protein
MLPFIPFPASPLEPLTTVCAGGLLFAQRGRAAQFIAREWNSEHNCDNLAVRSGPVGQNSFLR